MSTTAPAVRSVLAGNAAMVVTVLVWGSMAPLVHELLHHYDALEIAVLRNIGAAPLFVTMLVLRVGGTPPTISGRGTLLRILVLGVIGVVVFATCYNFGIYYAGPVQAAIVNSAGPVIALGVGWLLSREKPDRALLAGIALAVPGAALALTAGNANATAVESPLTLAIGVAMILAANVAWAFYSALARRWLVGWPAIALTAATITAGGVLLMVLYLAAGMAGLVRFPPPAPTTFDLWLFAFVAVFSVCLGVVCWNFAVERLGLPLAAVYLNLIPMVAIAVSALLGATIEPAHILGAGLVIVGIGGAQLKRLRDARAADSEAQAAPSKP